ncbi:hypothetical protein AGMMS49940_02230 [Spirochaetia bacterium]|nr:hypothetical protein AGMMS49940_02230 [Spirochaetia bacterium]
MVHGFVASFLLRITYAIRADQLKWGIYRLYIDSLLYFGNVNQGYDSLCNKNELSLSQFFESKRFPTEKIIQRGTALEFEEIKKDDRYLISEMACKTYGSKADSEDDLKKYLIDNYKNAVKQGKKRVLILIILKSST